MELAFEKIIRVALFCITGKTAQNEFLKLNKKNPRVGIVNKVVS
jgi:hypothetical protein